MTDVSNEALPLRSLHERHRGLTEALGRSYLEAASVCFSRHHSPPIDVSVSNEDGGRDFSRSWDPPDERTLGAWANEDDATRDGAYAVVIASIEALLDLYAFQRAETRTGADYYVGRARDDSLDLENALRLEVSGVDHGAEGVVTTRVAQKAQQTRQGSSNLPAIVGVAGFRIRVVMLRRVVA